MCALNVYLKIQKLLESDQITKDRIQENLWLNCKIFKKFAAASEAYLKKKKTKRRR